MTAAAGKRPDHADPILRSCFDVSAIPGRDRYDLWRDSIGCVFDVSPGPLGRPDADFQACVDAYRIDNVIVAHTVTREQSWQRSAIEIARDGMDHYMVQLFLEGGMSWQRHRSSGEIQPGDMVLFDLSQPMSSQTSAFSHLSLILPRALLAPLLATPDDHHMRHLSGHAPYSAMLHEEILQCHAMAAAEDAQACRNRLSALVTLLAVSLEGPERTSGNAADWRQWQAERQIHNFIERHLADQNLGPDAICDALNLSRSALYRHFGEEGGVMRHIRERRLSSAVRLLLAMPGQPVGEVASRTGFASASDFSRVFRRHFGMTPREVRHRWHFEYAMRWHDATGRYALDRKYERWLHHLTQS